MTDQTNIISALVADLIAKAGTVQARPDGTMLKPLAIYNVEDLQGAIKNMRPAVGVLYEGMRSVPVNNESRPQRATDFLGFSAEAIFSLLLITEVSVMSQLIDSKTPAHNLLDQLRNAIQGTKNPAAYKWGWMLEAPASMKNSAAVWVQRYRTPVQVIPAADAATR